MNPRARRSIRIAALITAMVLVTLGLCTAEEVFRTAPETERKVFIENAAILDFQLAVDGGAVQIDGSELSLDDERLAELIPSSRRRLLVRALAKDARVDGDAIDLDTTPISVRNPRLQGAHSPVPRGRILDRRLRVVAESLPVPGRDSRGRIYPYGAAAYPVTGAAVTSARKQGLELRLDDALRGGLADHPARERALALHPPQAGDDVVLTIDAEMQQAIYRAFEGRRGAAVLMDVDTGEVLAYVSAPSWDPNVWDYDLDTRRPWRNTFDAQAWEQAGFDREQRPMLDRAGGESKPPGSTFKAVTASAWLGAGHLPAESVRCLGRSRETRLRCHIHRLDTEDHAMDLLPAIAESCNTFFGLAGQELGPSLGTTATGFGFNARFDLLAGVPDASWPTAPSFAFAERGEGGAWLPHDERWYRANRYLVAQGAIGQNVVEATPLQMATVTAVIANGGRWVDPHLVKELRTGRDPSVRDDHGVGYLHVVSTPGARVVAAEDAALIQRGMVMVMADGTGRKLTSEETADGLPAVRNSRGQLVSVAGKTGTAEVKDHEPHSWFIGYAPADRPRIAVAVLVENAGAGAEAAAPLGVAVLAEGVTLLAPGVAQPTEIAAPPVADGAAPIPGHPDDADASGGSGER